MLEALEIVPQYSAFTFDRKTNIQLRGTAMGTKCAPVYATLVIAFLETKLYENFEKSSVWKQVLNSKANV